MSRVVVVGAGLAGLSAACHLAGQGHDVTVLERGAVPGGRASRAVEQGYAFDLGPTVMTAPELLDEPLRAIGSSQAEAVPMRPLDPGYRGVFADGSELLTRPTPAATAREITALAGQHEAAAFLRLGAFLERLYALELPNFIDKNFDSPLGLVHHPLALLRLAQMGAFGKFQTMIDSRIGDDRLRRMLTFQALYAGLSPARALGVYAVISYLDVYRGVQLPAGGMGAIATGLANALTAHGVEIAYDTPATGILRRSDGVIAGVATPAGPIAADAVVATPDISTAYRTLLPDLTPPRAVRRPAYSPSAVVWHLGVRGELPAGTAHHNIHFGPDWDGAFDALTRRGELMAEPSRLVTVSSHGEPGLAPPGGHTLYVLEPVPGLRGQVDWHRERPRIRERLLEFCAAAGYPTEIEAERLVTPLDWARDGLAGGTPFGLAHNFLQTGPFRPPNVERRVPGLFFAGDSTTPGVGVPMVLISGKLAAARVAAWFGGGR